MSASTGATCAAVAIRAEDVVNGCATSLISSVHDRLNEKPLTVAHQGFVGAISFAPDLRTKRVSQVVSRIMTRFDFDLDRAVRACRQH